MHAYGTRIDRILGTARRRDDLGPNFGADLTAAEVRYLMTHEWAQTADDVLWRRSKLGLLVSPDGSRASGEIHGGRGRRIAARCIVKILTIALTRSKSDTCFVNRLIAF